MAPLSDSLQGVGFNDLLGCYRARLWRSFHYDVVNMGLSEGLVYILVEPDKARVVIWQDLLCCLGEEIDDQRKHNVDQILITRHCS